MNPLEKYFDEVVGRRLELSKALDITPSAVSQWASDKIPVGRLADVERVTGIPREKLRPDIFYGKSKVKKAASH